MLKISCSRITFTQLLFITLLFALLLFQGCEASSTAEADAIERTGNVLMIRKSQKT